MKKAHETIMDLVGTACLSNSRTKSLPEALGIGVIQIHSIGAELARPGDEQDAEALMQALVALAAVAIDAAARHVLPCLESDNE